MIFLVEEARRRWVELADVREAGDGSDVAQLDALTYGRYGQQELNK